MADAPLLPDGMSSDDIATAVKLLDVDLAFLFNHMKIPLEVQAAVANLGYTEVTVFAKMEDTAAAFRKTAQDDVRLDPAQGPRHRSTMARLVATWEAAQQRVQRRQKEEAEQRVGDLPRVLPKGMHLDLARSFNKVHKELTEKQTPAPCYIESKLEEIEDGS